MANTLKIKRGAAATIPNGALAEPLFTSDTYDLYIGKGDGTNQRFQKYIASGTSSQFLKGDGSLDSTTYQATSEKGQNNGYASLDAGGKIPAAQLPSTVIEYKGTWNASTNTPTLADGTGDAGDVYIVSVGGTQNLGSGSITFDAGDWVMYNGSVWQKSTGSNAVASVNGQTGIVVLDTDDISEPVSATNLWFTNARARAAISLTTTGTSGASTYDNSTGVLNIPQYQAVLTNPVTGTGTNNEIAYFNTTGSTIASLSTATYPSLTELSYVKGVTSAIQTQLNAKEPTVTKGNLTETTSSVLTITGGTGAVIGSGTTIAVASAGAAQAGVVTTGTQTFAGAKTFNSSVTASALYVSGMTAGSGAIYHTGSRLTFANYNASGVLNFEVNGGASAMTINADKTIQMDYYTTNGFVKFSSNNGTLTVDTNTYLTTSSAASTYVPYTGATTNVNIGTNSMTAFNFYASSTFYVDSNNYFMKSILELRDNATSTKRIYITADTSESLISTVNTVPLKLRATSGVTEQVVLNTNGTISFTGAATFSSSVTAANTAFGASGGYIITYGGNAASRSWRLANDINAFGDFSIQQSTTRTGATYADILNFNASGAATFSSSVTATNYIVANTGGSIQTADSGGYVSLFGATGSPSNSVLFGTNNTERMRITSGGEVLINQTSVEAQLTVNALSRNVTGIRVKSDSGTPAISIGGTGALRVDYPGVGGGRFEINDSGTAYLRQYSNGTLSISSGQVVSSSDKNLKIDDGAIESALPKVLGLNPRYFYWKEDSGIESKERQLGFYAQDIKEALGEEVANQNQNGKWGIYDRGIIAMLTKAIQEQQAQIEELKSKLN